MRELNNPKSNKYSGLLLAAHPGMGDPRFTKTVILVSTHSKEAGAMGVVINRPLNKTLGQIGGKFVYSPLAKIPIYQGGPVAAKQLIFTAWQWNKGQGVFKLHFGINHLKAQEIIKQYPDMEIRCFMGHAGWNGGQLESELKQNAWFVSPFSDKVFSGIKGDALWKSIVFSITPELRLLTDVPKDPSNN